MTHPNLTLTETAIKNHSKRLQKELHNLNQNLSLCETQNLFAKTLGFNNFHELKRILLTSNAIQFNEHEKFILVIFSLIIDNQKDLALKLLKEYYSAINNSFLIELCFEKYIQSNLIKEQLRKGSTKENIFISLLDMVRKEIIFASSYLLFLKKIDFNLWNIINLTGRLPTNNI